MTTGRFPSIIATVLLVHCLLIGTAFAGFFSSDDKGKSGLDFNKGYDVNMVITISGRVVSLPHPGEKGNVLIEIKSGNETFNLSVGPGSYWGKKGIAINLNDELAVKGSKAQGLDGKSYVLTQKLVNRTTGAQVELRSENGEPAWSGRDMNSMPERPAGGMRGQGGGMMRGGGGGMMRR